MSNHVFRGSPNSTRDASAQLFSELAEVKDFTIKTLNLHNQLGRRPQLYHADMLTLLWTSSFQSPLKCHHEHRRRDGAVWPGGGLPPEAREGED